MPKPMHIAALAGLAAATFASPLAAQSVKPGLWEMTINSKMVGEGIPGNAAANAMKMKICIKPEESQAGWQDMVKNMQPGDGDDCTISDLKQSAGAYSFTTKCKSGMSGTMTGKISPTLMQQSGDMVFADESMNMKMQFNNTSRWLAASCPPGTLGAK